MLKTEWGAESNVELPHLIILGSKVCGGRPAFDRTAALVPAFAVKYLPLGRTLI